MTWAKIIAGIVQLIGWLTRYLDKKEVEDNIKAKVELERRDAQDDILDDVRDADPDSVSDDEIISGR
jgi:hypothetical protein